MESTSPLKDNGTAYPIPFSHFSKTVVLQDWWLIKADDADDVSRPMRLGVAGFTSKDMAVRAFSSAPIRRSVDVFTLETVDGITILLKGFINKSRTEKNGFPSEVFKKFVFGFPDFWEVYIEKFIERESGDEDFSSNPTAPEMLVTDSGGHDDFPDGTPNTKRKAVINSRDIKSHKKDPKKAVNQSANAHTKRITRSTGRLHEANPCLDNLCEGTLDCNMKDNAKSRLKECDNKESSQAGKENTGVDLIKKREIVIKSSVANCEDNDSSQAGNDNKTKKRVLRICSRFSDANQKGEFRTEGRKRKSNVEEENSSSKKKTRRKLTYEKILANREKTDGASSASPEVLSLKKSRSGRKLLPVLEFWRNQKAVYDKERQLTCIESGPPGE